MEEDNGDGVGLLREEGGKMNIDVLNLGGKLWKTVGARLACSPIWLIVSSQLGSC